MTVEVPHVLLAYANPAITTSPVPPYGMERIAQAMRLAGCQVTMVAPFVEENPLQTFIEAMEHCQPDLVGFSVRNIDDTLLVRGTEGSGDLDTTFYLDDIEPLCREAVRRLGTDRVMAGGAAVGAGPEGVLRYLGLSWGFSGPAEDLCWRMGRSMVKGDGATPPDDPRVVYVDSPRPRPRGHASAWRPPPGPTPRMREYLRLTVARNSRVPVQIAHGCDRRCAFCVEARTTGFQIASRDVDDIIGEIAALHQSGVRKFWLTTSELNAPNERHALAVLDRLREYPADYRVYLQAAPFSEALLDALEAIAVDPAGLNIEFGHLSDPILRAGGGPANRSHIDRLVELFLRRGYRQMGGSMLFGSHWLETWDTVDEAIAAIREIDAAFPDGLGLAYACGGRVYPETALADWIRKNSIEAKSHLYGDDDPTFVRPVAFSKPASPRELLRHVMSALEGTKGPIAPMNTETPMTAKALQAEQLVNRGIWRLAQEQPLQAEHCFNEALDHVPSHIEALRQLALCQANALQRPHDALNTLERLNAQLNDTDPRKTEVVQAIQMLSGSA